MNPQLKSQYHCRDARELSTILPDDSIDVTITSPPYGSLKDYGSSKQIGIKQSYDEYLVSLENVFGQVFASTKQTGSLWVIADTFKYRSKIKLLPFDLIHILERVGWKLCDIIIWNKTKTLPWSRKGQLRNVFEYILFFSKGETFKYYVERVKETENLKQWWVKFPERYNPFGKAPTNLWTFPIPVQGSFGNGDLRHACPFPAELVERILLLTSDPEDCVLDPFAGSGVVLARAHWMGRKYVGFDVNSQYVKQFYRLVKDRKSKLNGKARDYLSLDRKRASLADQILKLRQVKFPKALFSLLCGELEQAVSKEIQAIVSVSSPLTGTRKPHQLGKLMIYILYTGTLDCKQVEQKAKALIERRPLSKYGLVAEVHVKRMNSFLQTERGILLGERSLFAYTEGRTNITEGEVKLVDWLAEERKPWTKVPPILSSVEVRQPVIQTWQPTDAQASEEGQQ